MMESFLNFEPSMNSISATAFFHLVFVCFISLFPPVNPIGTAFVVGPFFRGHSKEVRRNAALTIALYCLTICLVAALLGGFFFKLFGISVPVVQLAGGFIIARMGLGILSRNDILGDEEKAVTSEVTLSFAALKTHLFYPLAFPTTTGGGTIAVLLALSANSYHEDPKIHLFNLIATCVACVLMCLLIFICYYSAPAILDRLNPQGVQVCNKLSGFLTFCVGIQIIVNGGMGLFHQLKP